MSHKNKPTLNSQVDARLDEITRFGRKKSLDKANDVYKKYIYSYSTLKSYKKHCKAFAKYCHEKYRCKNLEECRPYVDEYLQMRICVCSAYTVKLDACALAKLYECSSTNFIKTPDRKRADIIRSRGEKVRDKHFSEKNHYDLVSFCKGTGLRRHEIVNLRGTDLVFENGRYYVHVRCGKGGKERKTLIIGNVDQIVELMNKAGKEKVFQKVANGADIHGYRRVYATTLYNMVAKPLDELTKKEKYYCRKDKKGIIYDKNAMQMVSKNLGHNRLNVIADHYLDFQLDR